MFLKTNILPDLAAPRNLILLLICQLVCEPSPKKRKKYSSQFKFKVALEAVKGAQTLNELASQNGVHPNQVGTWKKQLIEEGPTVFGQDTARQLQEQTEREAELYEQIGRLKMELEWLKKKLPRSGDPQMSSTRNSPYVGGVKSGMKSPLFRGLKRPLISGKNVRWTGGGGCFRIR